MTKKKNGENELETEFKEWPSSTECDNAYFFPRKFKMINFHPDEIENKI